MAGRVQGQNNLLRKLRMANGMAHRDAEREVKRSSVAIQSGAKKRVKVDQGELRNSVAHQIFPDQRGNMLSSRIGTNKVHGPPTEFGRRPGTMPPVDKLERWAQRKGLPKGTGYVVARKIAREGTPPAPFLFPAFEEERPRFVRRLQRALDEAHRKVARG